jgi:pimeloyl-ACP methyl ester carboxylesterase
MARHFAENGFRFLKFNFSHNGTTADKPIDFADLIAFGDNTFTMELSDLNAVVDFVSNGPAMPVSKEIYLIGHSRGGGISIIKTSEDKRVKKLVTMAAISDFQWLWPKETEDQWRLQGVAYVLNTRTGQKMPLKISLLNDMEKHPAHLNILKKAAKIKQPWLIVHGDEDASVPLSQAEELKKANPNAELCVIKGANHTFNVVHPFTENTIPGALLEFCNRTITFLKQ